MELTRLSGFSAVSFGLTGLLFLSVSCQHEGIPADQMEQVCFNQQVLPIFQNSCATSGCHDTQTAESGYIFTDYASIMKAITPGDASKSKAYKSITSQVELMPPHNPLPKDKRILIRIWIEQGAKETDCPTEVNNSENKSASQWACYESDIQPIFTNGYAILGYHNSIFHSRGMELSNYAKAFALPVKRD